MLARGEPIVQVRVYEEQSYGFMQYPAYGGRFRFDSIARRDVETDPDKTFRIEQVPPSVIAAAKVRPIVGGFSADGSPQQYPAVTFLPSPVECLIATPFLDTTQEVDLDYFYLLGAFQDGWDDMLQDDIRPWIDESSVLCHNDYRGYTTSAGYWCGVRSAFQYPADPIICLALYRTGPSSNTPAGVTPSTLVYFGINANCTFCLQIGYDVAPVLWVKHNVYTQGQWRQIHASHNSSPLRVIGNPSWRGQPDPPLTWILPAAGGIAVSDDGLRSLTFFPVRWVSPDAVHPWGKGPLVPGGPIELWHNAGQWGFAVVPLNMMDVSKLQTPLVQTPFDWGAPLLAEPYFLRLRQDEVFDINGAAVPDGAAVVIGTYDTDDSRIPDSRLANEYRIGIPRVLATSVFSTTGNSKRDSSPGAGVVTQFTTYTCPRVYDLIYGQPALMATPPTPTYEDRLAKVFSIGRDSDRIDFDGDVELDASQRRENDLTSIERPRAVTVAGYWNSIIATEGEGGEIETTTEIVTPVAEQAQAAGFVSEVDVAVQGGQVGLRLPIHGVGRFISGSRRLSDTFPLDWMLVTDALRHCANWCGIPDSLCNFEDLGLRLNGGPHNSELFWYAESGDRIGQLMQEINLYACNAAMWVAEDGRLTTGCPYCHTQRTAATASAHFGKGPASAACLAADVVSSGDAAGLHYRFATSAAAISEAGVDKDDPMEWHVVSLSKPSLSIEQHYSNCVRIKGPTYGKPDDSHTFDLTDWHSVLGTVPHPVSNGFTLGHKRPYEKTYAWAVTEAMRCNVAFWLLDQMMRRPEFCEIVVPYQPGARLGQTFRVWGNAADDAGLTGKVYRVWSYHHRVNAKRQRESGTTLVGRFMDNAA